MLAGSIEIQLLANIARLQRDMDSARQVVGNATASMARAADMAKTALASIGTGIGLQQIIRLSDEYTKFTAQLRLATQSQREYAQAYADVKRISTTAQADLAATGVLYARIANGTRELGVSQQKVAAITETVNLALRVSGATTEEAHSAMLQLSQAFAAGALRGEEFNAVNEAAPGLMKILADGMGVSVGALKKMASEGQITSKVMADVFGIPSEKLQAQSKEVQTIAGAFTVLKNNVLEFTGTQAQANGMVSVLTGGIGLLAKNLSLLAGATATIGAAKLGSMLAGWTTETYRKVAADQAAKVATLAAADANLAAAAAASAHAAARMNELRASALSTQGQVQLAVVTNGLIPMQARAAAAAEVHAAALRTQAVAASAASVSGGVARGALVMLGGPIGAIITALGLAATAWMVWGRSAQDSTKQATESYEEAHKRIVKGLDEQIVKNEKLIQLQNLGMTKPEIDRNAPVLAQIEAASKRLNDINNRTGEFGSGKSNDDLFFARAQVMKDIIELTGKMQKGDASAASAAAGNTEGLIAIRMRLAGVNKQYLDDLTTLQAKRAAGAIGEKEYIDLVSQLATEEYKKSEAGKAAASSATKQENAYESLIKSIREKIAASATEMNGFDNLSDSQKLTIKLNDDIAVGLIKRNGEQAKNSASLIAQVKANEDVIASQKRAADGAEAWAKISKELGDTRTKSIEDAIKEAEKNEELARTFGLTKTAIEAMELARLEAQLSQRFSLGLTLDEIDTLEKLIAAKKRSAAAVGDMESMEAAKKASEDLDKFLDPSKAQSFGEALRTAFGAAGDSLTKLTGSLQDYGIKQAEIEKQRGNAALAYLSGMKSEKDYLANIDALNLRSAKNQMASYGDMTGAAAGFFDEHSRGYQALMTASQVFHAAELAMTMAELVPKAISAVLTQGSGDPYTAFARMATMAAIVTGLGVAIGGVSGGDTTAKDRQAAVGTGSVLGDSKAKSESISKSLDAIDDNTYQGLTVSMGMLDALRAIQNGIGGLGNILIRTSGFSTETAATQFGGAANLTNSWFDPMSKLIGNKIGGIPGKIANALFGGNVHSIDTGLMMQASSLGQIASSGALVSQYNDTKTDGGLFRSDEYGTRSVSLGAEVNDQFTKILLGMRDGITEAGKLLGLTGDAFNAQLNSFVVDLGKISTKDMKPAEVQAALEAALSKAGDDMAKFAVTGLQQFQKAGEGYLETLVRIADDYQTVDVVLQSLGITCNALGVNSVAARERLIEMSGGLDKFTSSSEQFLKDFYTDQERAAALKARIDPTLAKYGLSTDGPDAMKAFRDVVKGLDITTESGAQAYATLIGISSSFKAIVDAGKSVEDALQSMKDAASGLLGDVDNAFSVLQKVTQSSINTLNERIAKEKALSDAIRSTLDSMKVQGSEMTDRVAAQAQIRAALAIAKAGGPLPDADALKKALSAVAQDASSQFATQTDYLRDFYRTQNDIAALGDLADSALSVDQQSLNALTGMLDAAQKQIDILKGIDVTGLTIAQALAGFQTAIGSAQANPIIGATSGIADLYKTLLGRAPDAAGLAYWQEKAAGGLSMDAIMAFIKQSAEYKDKHPIPGFANGGDFMGGVRMVGERGPEIEFTGPSRIASYNALMSRLSSPSDNNAALAAAVDRLTATVAQQQQTIVNLERAMDGTQRNTKRSADFMERFTQGGTYMPTKEVTA